VFGHHSLPYTALMTGAAGAAGVIVLDMLLKRWRSPLRLPVLPVAIGMYLPISLSVPMFVGALLPIVVRRATRHRGARVQAEAGDRTVLLWSGLITGEAMVGLVVAVPLWLNWHIPTWPAGGAGLSMVLFVAVILLVLHCSLPSGTRPMWRRR
jgi:uncharacterized oligopeptide transporter (OPT) family protein